MTETEVRLAGPHETKFDVWLHKELTRELERRWPRDSSLIDEACRHSLIPAGKLFRPILLLASVDVVGGDVRGAFPAAISAETGHVASLIHDDIIDHDALRRGRPSAWTKYGVDEAIIAGDLLLFYIFACLAECRDTGVPADRVVSAVASIAAAGLDLCRGQSMEAQITEGRRFDAAAYVEMVRLKTGALFRASCQVGAIMGGGDQDLVDLLSGYADHLGIAFQVHDDLLAYFSDEERTGKKATSDISNGRVVLPIILAYQSEPESGRREIERCLSGQVDPVEALNLMREILHRTGALEEAIAIATRHAESALEALSKLPGGAGRDVLADYAMKVLDGNGA